MSTSDNFSDTIFGRYAITDVFSKCKQRLKAETATVVLGLDLAEHIPATFLCEFLVGF